MVDGEHDNDRCSVFVHSLVQVTSQENPPSCQARQTRIVEVQSALRPALDMWVRVKFWRVVTRVANMTLDASDVTVAQHGLKVKGDPGFNGVVSLYDL